MSMAIAVFAVQLIGPFFVIFLQQKGGGIEQLGILFGVSVLASSLTMYYIGRWTDTIGRKPFLIVGSILASVITILYLYVQSLPQLYILQIAFGINSAMWEISERSFMADITPKKTRGRELGFYEMILGIIAAIGLMMGGFIIGKFGFSAIFWFIAISLLVSTIPLFWIREARRK